MNPTSLLFGDIFLYDDGEYVFLAATADQIYAAKILDKELTKRIENCCLKAISNNKERVLRLPLYCYVILTTEEVQDRMATLAKTDGYSFEKVIKKLPFTLNEKDKKGIYQEISQSRSVSLRLKEQMRDIQL